MTDVLSAEASTKGKSRPLPRRRGRKKGKRGEDFTLHGEKNGQRRGGNPYSWMSCSREKPTFSSQQGEEKRKERVPPETKKENYQEDFLHPAEEEGGEGSVSQKKKKSFDHRTEGKAQTGREKFRPAKRIERSIRRRGKSENASGRCFQRQPRGGMALCYLVRKSQKALYQRKKEGDDRSKKPGLQ